MVIQMLIEEDIKICLWGYLIFYADKRYHLVIDLQRNMIRIVFNIELAEIIFARHKLKFNIIFFSFANTFKKFLLILILFKVSFS